MVGRAAPIGVFDSGVGGLTVVAELTARLPGESILYLGDTARLPYGTKSATTVERYTRANLDFLRARGVKAVVVACNTASAVALPALTAQLPISLPVWGVIEPGARAAAKRARRRVGVIATESTVASDAYGAALRRARPDLAIESRACPLFVPLVEEGWESDPIAEAVARRYLAGWLPESESDSDSEIDTLVLGCTHYPLLRPVLSALLGPAVTLVDSASAVVDEIERDLAARDLAAPAPRATVEHHFCVTDAGDRFDRMARRILGRPGISLELVDVR